MRIKISLSTILLFVVILLGAVPLIMINSIVNKTVRTNILDNRSEITNSLLDQSQKYLNLFLDEINNLYIHIISSNELGTELLTNTDKFIELKKIYANNSYVLIFNTSKNIPGVLIDNNNNFKDIDNKIKENLLKSQQGLLLLENSERSLWLGIPPAGMEYLPTSIWNYRSIKTQTDSYIIISSINTNRLQDFIQSIETSIKSEVRLITSDNNIYPPDKTYFSNNFALKTLSRTNKGRFIQFSSDNLLVHVYSDPIYFYNLVVITPEENLFKIYNKISNTTSNSIFVLTLVSLCFGFFFIFVLRKRIKILIDSLKGISNGIYKINKPKSLIVIKEDLILSNAILDAYNEIEVNRNKLKQINENLETIVDQRTRELKLTKESLINSEKMAIIGENAAKISHEINNPLGISITATTHLSGNIDELHTKFNTDQLSKSYLKEFIETSQETVLMIEQNLQRAADLSKDFKKFASDQYSNEKIEIDLKIYLEEIIKSYSYNIKDTNFKIILNSQSNIKLITYPIIIYQTVTNLINNSFLHGFEGKEKGIINIKLENIGNDVIIKIMDDGNGISFENQPKLFTPFFTTKKGHGGTGLGLNIIKELIEQRLNGIINFNSTPEKGAEFIITIPKEI
ncbi:MAG: HAMP domain-containing histidine kinase [Spirochaetales bacterium]|nr:HAMP domain-containing histidine kinase [Spirochaetales bacterium]